MNQYVAFYGQRRLDVDAETSFKAREKAAEVFQATHRYKVAVVLVAKDGVPVLQRTSDI